MPKSPPNPHKVLAVKRNIFHGHGVFGVFLTPFSPGSGQRRRRPSVGDPAWLSKADATPGPEGQGRAAPNTHADSGAPAPRGQAAVPGTRPSRSRYSFVPGFAAIQERRAHLLQGRVQFGKAHGWGGSSGDSSFLAAAVRRGSGGLWDDASASSPHSWRRPRGRSRFVPRPASGPRPVGGPSRFTGKAEAAGVPSSRRAAGATAKDMPERTHGPMTSVGHRCGWPPGRPLGVGSPAAPGFNVSRSVGRQRPPWYGAWGRRPGPAGPTLHRLPGFKQAGKVGQESRDFGRSCKGDNRER